MAIAMKPIPGMLNGRPKTRLALFQFSSLVLKPVVVRPDRSLAGPNELDELLVRGGSAALGYKGNDKATRETFVDGWMRTGDQIRIDEDEGCKYLPSKSRNDPAQPDKLITNVSVTGVSGGCTSDECILFNMIEPLMFRTYSPHTTPPSKSIHPCDPCHAHAPPSLASRPTYAQL
ncbi:hypothetical protein EV424DRAFT_1544378 [Suillus variegatus]|nr:hypothetical protein EV424DRAFT_1544378 [Suillus variegatus]